MRFKIKYGWVWALLFAVGCETPQTEQSADLTVPVTVQPVGLGTISASVGEDASTIEEVYEPYLMQLGFLDRTPRGRVGTLLAFEYFKLSPPSRGQINLQL